MSWIKCDSKVKAKCSFKNKCCGDQEGLYLEGSECDKFAQKVLSEPPTNADRIRAMSDEELAKMLWKTGRNYRAICADPVVDYREHSAELLEWLKQPVKEDA